MNILFFELISVAIGNQVCLSHTLNADEWGELYAMAKKQSLVGICFAGVQRLVSQKQSPPEMLYMQWMGMAAKIQQRNETLNKQCVDLQKRLSAEGLNTAVLKGLGVAALYKLRVESLELRDLSALRQSGDIDLWVDAPKEKVVERAEKTGSKEKASYLHVGAHFFNDTDVELHYRPTYMRNPWHNERMQEFCEQHKGDWIERNGLIVPSFEFDVVYQLSHIYRHLFGSGIGLRQLMDYYFVLMNTHRARLARTGGSNIVHELTTNCSINFTLKNLGLDNFAGAVMYVLRLVFGMDEQYMICKPDEVRGKALLRHVMQTGNFGHQDERQKEARSSAMGTMIYKIKQWVVLMRFYPEETIFAPYWACCKRLKG